MAQEYGRLFREKNNPKMETSWQWKLMSKAADNEEYSDYHYFPYKNDSMTAAFINLDDADPENGGLCIHPRSHKFGPMKDVGTIEKGQAFHYMDPKEWPIVAKRRGCHLLLILDAA
ncbi:uncharacterized protein LOC133527247 [Cydia pomonella]|uniref:uncharacterized protein LOC133527247 n=1 Tax=Cydia pomonella TaxID=82600 RepID=UPI002ADD6126|nr:uncharacterized protein LOC133527247 [Cydia pomonella]